MPLLNVSRRLSRDSIAAMFLLCLALQVDPHAGRQTAQGLAPFGIKCYSVSSQKAAERMLSQWRFDMILVNGADFTDELPVLLTRLARAQVPIVLSTLEEDETRLLRYLESGATTLIDSGLSGRLTAMRLIRLAQMRIERGGTSGDEIRRGALVLDPHQMTAMVGDKPVRLTPHLFQALLLLASNPGEFVHRQTLAGLVRGADTRSVDMTISRLRRELRDFEDLGISIQTVIGRGYRLQVEDVAVASTLAWV